MHFRDDRSEAMALVKTGPHTVQDLNLIASTTKENTMQHVITTINNYMETYAPFNELIIYIKYIRSCNPYIDITPELIQDIKLTYLEHGWYVDYINDKLQPYFFFSTRSE